MTELDATSRQLRLLIVAALHAGDVAHIGPAFSLIEILRVLYDSYLQTDPSRPDWPDRDRLILSKGHGGLALYAALTRRGVLNEDTLRSYGRDGSPLTGHPERGVPGVEASTGSLGHGLSLGVGMALAARMQARPSRVVVVVGDGELNEGSNWEAAIHAVKHGLDRLTVFVDHNGLQCFGAADSVAGMQPLAAKFESFGFGCTEVDGHSVRELESVTPRLPLVPGRPSAVICRTVKGRGLPAAEGSPAWHQVLVTEALLDELRARLAPDEAPVPAGRRRHPPVSRRT
jgi:transketolase